MSRTFCFISLDLRPVNKTGFFLTILLNSVSLSSSFAFGSSSSFVPLQDPNSTSSRLPGFCSTYSLGLSSSSKLDVVIVDSVDFILSVGFFIDWEGLNFCFIVCGVTVAACLFMCFRKQLFFLKRGPHVRHLYLWPEHKKS